MKKIAGLVILLLISPVFIPAPAKSTEDTWIKITMPQPGIYLHCNKIMNSRMYIFIGTDSIHVLTNQSNNILMVYFAIYNVITKEMVQGEWDTNGNDGFSYTFTNLHTGIYAIAAIAAAFDINEPVAFDWIMPVIVIN